MYFGDIAKTVKPIPNVRIGTEVQISAVGVYKGKLSYTVVVRDAAGNLVDEVGPYPASAFQFVDRCTTGSELLLIDWLSKHGKGK
jgi:hypothetical protein